ncbi:hypothetical protein ACQPUC_06855, partial [Erwinia amylovora]|uniref:hypothetical protein n=1 Tax=Erwinia amylovora TaxID=552 RepID=UPI003CFEB65D
KHYEFKRWITDLEDGKWLQDNKGNPSTKKVAAVQDEPAVAEAASVLSSDGWSRIKRWHSSLISWRRLKLTLSWN